MFCQKCGAGNQRRDAYCTRFSLVLNLQLRRRLARGRAAQTASPAELAAAAAPSLNAADAAFAAARSVTEHTTELFAGVPRARRTGEPK